MRKIKQIIGLSIIRITVIITIVFLFSLLYVILVNGARIISPSFILEFPKNGMTKGGIFPAIMGTFLLSIGAVAFAMPLGILGSIYLREYAKEGRLIKIIRIGINNLAGVPSVVFGLFGLAVFVKFFDFGVSILSGSLTLGILILPVIIRSTEEAIASVPKDFREASYALGATKWQTIRNVVLPTALPGILTGAILGIGRAAGETAPILFTAATFYNRHLPSSIFDEVMTLPYHIYALLTEGVKPECHIPIAYGTAMVLLLLVLGINLIAIIIRYKSRKVKKW